MTREKLEKVIAAIKKMRLEATDDTAYYVPDIYPEWKEDTDYIVGDKVRHNGKLYKVLQAHTSQSDWTPDVAVSLFAEVLPGQDGDIGEWVQPTSANPYMKGDKVKHNGDTWESLIDNNVWEPSEAVPTLWQRLLK